MDLRKAWNWAKNGIFLFLFFYPESTDSAPESRLFSLTNKKNNLKKMYRSGVMLIVEEAVSVLG